MDDGIYGLTQHQEIGRVETFAEKSVSKGWT